MCNRLAAGERYDQLQQLPRQGERALAERAAIAGDVHGRPRASKGQPVWPRQRVSLVTACVTFFSALPSDCQCKLPLQVLRY